MIIYPSSFTHLIWLFVGTTLVLGVVWMILRAMNVPEYVQKWFYIASLVIVLLLLLLFFFGL